MKVYHRRAITLVELLIVIGLLAMASGVVGINVVQALKQQRFRTEVEQVTDTFRLAQDLMLILGVDVHVRVKARGDKSGIDYWLDVEGGVPSKWKHVVDREPRLLRETHGVFFEEQQPFPIVPGQLDIRFTSGGSLMSRGVFRMSTHEEENVRAANVRAICLKGFPHPIFSVVEGDDPIECEGIEAFDSNGEITEYTIQEIFEDNAIKKAMQKEKKEPEGEKEEETNGEEKEEESNENSP